jgi:CBS domain-containing protein
MTSEVRTIGPDATVDECIRTMEQFKVRRLPVTNPQGQLLGIVAQADLVRRAIPQPPEMMEELEEALEEELTEGNEE